VSGIVCRCQKPLTARTEPTKGQKTIPGPVPFPGRLALEQVPLPLTHDRLMQHPQQSVVKLLQLRIGRFVWAAAEMRRYALFSPFELSLVKEPQPRRQKRDDGRGLMDARGERGGCARLVVVFQKAGHL